jgi:hypothetical protein
MLWENIKVAEKVSVHYMQNWKLMEREIVSFTTIICFHAYLLILQCQNLT